LNSFQTSNLNSNLIKSDAKTVTSLDNIKQEGEQETNENQSSSSNSQFFKSLIINQMLITHLVISFSFLNKAPLNEKSIETLTKANSPVQFVLGQHNHIKQRTRDSNASDSPTSGLPNLTREIINNRLKRIDESQLPAHLKIGSQFKFRIIIVEVSGISSEYSDIFCQFNFMHQNDEAFSTEPIPNTTKDPPLGFFHIQDVY
jgi:hypothetical protein